MRRQVFEEKKMKVKPNKAIHAGNSLVRLRDRPFLCSWRSRESTQSHKKGFATSQGGGGGFD
jgi:hypothetical protein